MTKTCLSLLLATMLVAQVAGQTVAPIATLVNATADAVTLVQAKAVGWNRQKCPVGLNEPGKGSCTPASCAKGGIASKWESTALKKNELGYELYVKGDPTTVLKASAQSCCNACAAKPGCTFWQYIPGMTFQGKKTVGACYMIKDNIDVICGQGSAHFSTETQDAAIQIRTGGECNPSANIVNDPHLVGAHGTRFDFNGQPNRAFCLLTDKDIHVNMLLRGYYDERTEGASVLHNGKAVRTWIKELGVVWHKGGVDHKLRLVARNGKQQERGEGFMATIEVNGQAIPRLAAPGATHKSQAGGLTVTLVAYEKTGAFDVDFFRVEVEGLAVLEVRLRIAHPLLQTPDDAETHINVAVADLKFTPDVHGVLGQTFRDDHVQRAMDFQKVVALLHRPIAADGDSGKGFLDGVPREYEVSSVLAPDCAHTVYERAQEVSGFVDVSA